MRIKIGKSPSADSRTAKKKITKDELLKSSEMHIGDVQKACAFLALNLLEAGVHHDHTKISGIDDFYADFTSGAITEDFKGRKWYSEQHLTERHHLTDRCPEDVNLIDVLERIADIVTAGLARSGEVYDDMLGPEVLAKAYKNTIELLKQNIEVFDE